MEKHDIKLKRINYLKQITKFREEHRNIVYTDETYLTESHTQPKQWVDVLKPTKGLRTPIGKGRRLVIVHAGGENGFIKDGLLIFKSGSKSGDYHDDMNHENFMRWVNSQLVPNLPPRSVLVVDNASYHNVKKNKCPLFTSKKSDMIDWCAKNHVSYSPNQTKAELYEIIKNKREDFEKFELDELLENHGHSVLRLPPYHPELNPIEKIWALMKNWVAQNNTTFKLKDVEQLARKRFEQIGNEEWKKICNHVKKIENGMIEKEHLLDDAYDIQFTINTGSSEDEDDFISDSDKSENYKSDLSGFDELKSDSDSDSAMCNNENILGSTTLKSFYENFADNL